MLIIRQYRIYRYDLKANPHILYIFGDNLDRQGLGGQAAEMRGEPNAFGIATKRGIGHGYPDDYFFDEQADVIPILKKEFARLRDELAATYAYAYPYEAVVIPLDGIGTGLSKMPEYAPKALNYINTMLATIEEI